MDGLRAEKVTDSLTVYQKDGVFRFGTDAVLLERYTERLIDRRQNVNVCELCAGTGLIGLLLADRLPTVRVALVEIMEEAAKLCQRSAAESGLDGRVTAHALDLRRVSERFKPESFGYVVCNPPYMRADCGKLCGNDAITAARHEIFGTIEDVCASAAYLLPTGGSFLSVYRTERLAALITAAEKASLAVKELCFVKTRQNDDECRLVLARAVKGAAEGMKTRIVTPDGLTGTGN